MEMEGKNEEGNRQGLVRKEEENVWRRDGHPAMEKWLRERRFNEKYGFVKKEKRSGKKETENYHRKCSAPLCFLQKYRKILFFRQTAAQQNIFKY
jgi:hypothetical protein